MIKRQCPYIRLIAADMVESQHHAYHSMLLTRLEEANNKVASTIASEPIDMVIHLAGMAMEGVCFDRPLDTCESNIRATYTLLNAIHRSPYPTRVVLSTTDKIYGRDATEETPYCENDALLPKNIYETSKACADLIARSFYLTYNLPLAIVRFANVYGSVDDNDDRLVPRTIKRLLQGLEPELRLTHDGREYTRDFIYISDLIDGIYTVARALLDDDPEVKGEAFNISSGKEYGVREVMETMLSVFESDARYETIRGGVRYQEIVTQCASNNKIHRVLGWQPKVSLRSGFQQMKMQMEIHDQLGVVSAKACTV
jgi:CDP-glucose 4,6-dehydratase